MHLRRVAHRHVGCRQLYQGLRLVAALLLVVVKSAKSQTRPPDAYVLRMAAMRLWGRQLWQHWLCWFWAVRSCGSRQTWRHGGDCRGCSGQCPPALFDAFSQRQRLLCVRRTELHLLLLPMLVD